MKTSMFDKVLAIGIVLAIYGISLKAGHIINKESLLDKMDQVEKTVSKQEKQPERSNYSQIRKEYQWDLEGAGDLGETFRSWD